MNSKYKFLIAGGSNTAITFALYSLMVGCGVNYNLSLSVTYILGIFLGFVINRLWTFKANLSVDEEGRLSSYSKPGSSQFVRYVLVYLIIFLVNFVLLNLMVQIFNLNAILSQAIAVAISVVFSYSLQKSWVFR